MIPLNFAGQTALLNMVRLLHIMRARPALGVILGVIDSGVNTSSAEFTGRIHADSDDFTGSNRGIDDEGGHGSAVTSVAAGSKNGNATHGIAFDTSILVLRTDTPGSCTATNPDPDDDGCTHVGTAISAAIDQARISGARVINISLGGDDLGGLTRTAIARATAAGIVVVVSAGNDGNADPDGFASQIADAGNGAVIIAGSVDAAGAISSFSNRGGNRAAFFLTALGRRVRADDHENAAFLWSGTSFSAPQITGAVALLAQAFPNLSGSQIVDLLFASAREAGVAGHRQYIWPGHIGYCCRLPTAGPILACRHGPQSGFERSRRPDFFGNGRCCAAKAECWRGHIGWL